MHIRALLILTMAALVAPAVRAQTPAPRGLISVNVGMQAPSRQFTDTFTFQRYLEDAAVTTDYEVKPSPFFDGGLAVRLWGPIGAGVALSRFSDTGVAAVQAAIPHPFFFNRSRSISGDAPGVVRNETAVHAQVVAFVPAGSRIILALSAGPSFLTVEQSVVTAVSYDEAYPYDEATFRTATLQRARKSKVAFNAGADLVVMLSRSFGVGGLIRFSQATVDLAIGGGRTLSVDAGGFQAGGGIRVAF